MLAQGTKTLKGEWRTIVYEKDFSSYVFSKDRRLATEYKTYFQLLCPHTYSPSNSGDKAFPGFILTYEKSPTKTPSVSWGSRKRTAHSLEAVRGLWKERCNREGLHLLAVFPSHISYFAHPCLQIVMRVHLRRGLIYFGSLYQRSQSIMVNKKCQSRSHYDSQELEKGDTGGCQRR